MRRHTMAGARIKKTNHCSLVFGWLAQDRAIADRV
jgi:hypothetical protein